MESPPIKRDETDRLGKETEPATSIWHLRRITTSGRYIPEIDGWRFIAIMAVVISHVPPNWDQYAGARYPGGMHLPGWMNLCYNGGGIGVSLFFTLSGFILGLPFAQQYLQGAKPMSLRQFYLRRVTRLEPPYLISMLLLFAAGLALKHFAFREQAPHLLASLVYVHNVAYGSASTINVAAWSLEVEVMFYLLAPALCWFFLGRTRHWYLLLPLAVILASACQYWFPLRLDTLAKYAHYFLVGIFAAAVLATSSPWVLRRAYSGDAALVFLVGAALLIWLYAPAWISLAYPWCFAGFIIFGLKSVWCSSVLRVPFFAITGGMCYTIYLYHGRLITLPIVFLFSKLKLSGDYASDILVLTTILVPFILMVSTVLFVSLERPFMKSKWPQDFSRSVSDALARLGWRKKGSQPMTSRATSVNP